MLLVLSSAVGRASAAAPCQSVSLDEVPRAARRSLEDGAGDHEPLRVCRLRVDGATVYRGHDPGNGITVDVAPSGEVLRRQWSGGR